MAVTWGRFCHPRSVRAVAACARTPSCGRVRLRATQGVRHSHTRCHTGRPTKSNQWHRQPISLIHLFVELVAKVLSLRLALRFSTLVSSNQSTFIARRCIHDNFLVQQMTDDTVSMLSCRANGRFGGHLSAAVGLRRRGLPRRHLPAKLPHLKPPANPDAVLAFLAGLGLSSADAAALVVRAPKLLCARVEKTLAPVVVGLTGLGLSRSEITRLALLAADAFRKKAIVSKLHYYMGVFGSTDTFFRVMKCCNVLSYSLERVVKPNVAYLRECGLRDCDIAKLCLRRPRIIITNPERVQEMVGCAESIGVPRYSGMFRHALNAVASFSKEEIAARVEHLKNTFTWTDAEVSIAVSKAPLLLNRSKESLQRRSEFLISEVGLEPSYIAHRPVMLGLSLEGRLMPRYYAVKFLKENGLLRHGPSYDTIIKLTEKAFRKQFIYMPS
uniref:mTERF domain-containing protein 1, mitochondrial n=1 Tax=Aegilops tauschii TaxID=37682 RepID=M8B3P0_AEGTA